MFHFCNFNFKFYNFKNIRGGGRKGRKEREGGGEVIPRQEGIRDQCSEAAEGESGTWASSSSAPDSLRKLR